LPGFAGGASGRGQAQSALVVINILEVKLSEKRKERRQVPEGANRMPSDSVFFDRLVPIILIALGVITIIIILVAAGILLGII
jgi:hypothetical protein